MKAWSKVWDGIRKPWIIKAEEEPDLEIDDIKVIKMAGDEVAAARNIYAEVEDPDMVDWAVYSLTAAEKRYDYLLKKYRQKK
ncbi:MAG: DUF2508 family protein [Syntrophomonas sp.]|nr:DUF2508 family protein [Syntrophomonas sp.]